MSLIGRVLRKNPRVTAWLIEKLATYIFDQVRTADPRVIDIWLGAIGYAQSGQSWHSYRREVLDPAIEALVFGHVGLTEEQLNDLRAESN